MICNNSTNQSCESLQILVSSSQANFHFSVIYNNYALVHTMKGCFLAVVFKTGNTSTTIFTWIFTLSQRKYFLKNEAKTIIKKKNGLILIILKEFV